MVIDEREFEALCAIQPNPRPWLGPDLMTKLVVLMAGEAYDADQQRVQIGNPG